MASLSEHSENNNICIQGSVTLTKDYAAQEMTDWPTPLAGETQDPSGYEDSLATSTSTLSIITQKDQASSTVSKPLRSRRDSYKDALRLLYQCNGSFTSFKLQLQFSEEAATAYIKSNFSINTGSNDPFYLENAETASTDVSVDLSFYLGKTDGDVKPANYQPGVQDRQSTVACICDYFLPTRVPFLRMSRNPWPISIDSSVKSRAYARRDFV